MSRRLWPRITDEYTANRLCPDAIARLYLGAPSARSSGVILFSLADHQFAPAQPGPTLPLIPPLSTRAPLSSPLTRRSRDNSLVKRADDASLFYRGLFPRLEIAFRAPTLCGAKETDTVERLFWGNNVKFKTRIFLSILSFFSRTEKNVFFYTLIVKKGSSFSKKSYQRIIIN